MNVRCSVLLALLVGCASAPDTDATVPAVRFRQFIVPSGMDFIHGGGRWFHCLYLPSEGVVAQVVWESPGLTVANHPRVYSYFGTINEYTGEMFAKSEEAKRPREEIRIPTSVAKRIVALARLEEHRRQEGNELGQACVSQALVGGEDTVRPKDFR